MSGFEIKTEASAPRASRQILKTFLSKVGFIPNVYGVAASAPPALAALTSLNECFEQSAFTFAEREIIALATSVQNECGYCVAGHTAFALDGDVHREVVEAVRARRPGPDARLSALARFTRIVVNKKGAVDAVDIRAFLNAGYETVQIIELLIGVAGKTMTNFLSKAGRIPLDDAFSVYAWTSAQDSSSDAQAA